MSLLTAVVGLVVAVIVIRYVARIFKTVLVLSIILGGLALGFMFSLITIPF